MQSSPARGMVPNGHLHPDPSGLQVYQDPLGGMQFDTPDMEAQSHALVEQAQRAGPTGRDAKMAVQRQLGIQAQFQPTFLSQPRTTHGAQVRPVPVSLPNGHIIHPGMATAGQYYVDAQGRHMPVVPFPQYARPVQHPQMAQQPTFQNMSAAQQQALLRHHFIQQSQMQQQQQIQQRQQAQFQSQQQLGRLAQTPSRPTPMLPVNHQSPAGTRTQPPSVNRSSSRADSRNPSPGPATRASSQPLAQATAQQGAASTLVGISAPIPANGALKAPSLPTQVESIPMAATHSQQSVSGQPQPTHPAFTTATAMQIPGPSYPAPRLPGTISIIEEALRKEEKVFHLQRVIEDAQTQLETIIKEEAIAHEVAKTQPSLVEMRERFDKHVLEFLTKAGYEEAASGLQHVMSDRYEHQGPAEEEGEGAQNGASGSQGPQAGGPVEKNRGPKSKASSPVKTRQNKTPTRSPTAHLALSASHPAMNDRADDMLGDGRNDAWSSQTRSAGSSGAAPPPSNYEMVVTPMALDDPAPDPFIAQVKQESSSPLKKTQSHDQLPEEDLGYLYSWWSVFEETQRLAKAKKLDSSIDLHSLTSVPFTALPPTSALATQIAVSAPAVAVRATSVDAGRTASRMGFATMTATSNGRPETATDHDDPVHAKLRAAEAMKIAQQAHIDAQNEDRRWRSIANARIVTQQSGFPIPPNQAQTFFLPNGQTVHMTSEQLHQHVLAQTSQALHQKQYTFPTVLVDPQFHPAGVPTGDVPDPQQPTPDRGPPPNNVQLGQPHYAGEPATSPSTNSGRSNKRGADPSPVDGQVKRAKTSNKRPTPEDHQRQAMEIASRVSGIHSPSSAMLGHIPQPNSGSGGAPTLPDPHRRYSQQAAQYAHTQMLASPAGAFPMSPPARLTSSPLDHMHHSPSAPFDMSAHLGLNGLGVPPQSGSANFRRPPGLDMDNLGDNESNRPPPSAASSTKRKATGRKPGPKAGTKKKPAKLKQTESDGEDGLGSAPQTGVQRTPPLGSGFQMGGPPGSAILSGRGAMFPPAGPMDEMRLDSSQFDQAQGYGHLPGVPPPSQSGTIHHPPTQHSLAATIQNGSSWPSKTADEKNGHPDEHPDDIFKAFEGLTGDNPPLSGTNEQFNSFDFDWGSANFGGEDHDWSGMPDTAVPDNIEG